jgi:hypothetical protein
MARNRHSPESITAVLRRVEAGMPIAELREINQLRDENTGLKRLVADLRSTR